MKRLALVAAVLVVAACSTRRPEGRYRPLRRWPAPAAAPADTGMKMDSASMKMDSAAARWTRPRRRLTRLRREAKEATKKP